MMSHFLSDVAITSFIMFPCFGSDETHVDFHSSACGLNVFNVRKGCDVLLMCEATGIPSAEIAITSDHQIWETPLFSEATAVALFQPDTLGSEGILTCRDRSNKTSISILVQRTCKSKSLVVVLYALIFCFIVIVVLISGHIILIAQGTLQPMRAQVSLYSLLYLIYSDRAKS
jgi:hypothetical protein